MHLALTDRTVRLPRLPVVGEVAALQGLEVHPEVAVVVLDHEATRRGARDDHPAPLRDEHRGPHRLTTGVLEHDVDAASAVQLTDLLAEPAPLPRVLFGVA